MRWSGDDHKRWSADGQADGQKLVMRWAEMVSRWSGDDKEIIRRWSERDQDMARRWSDDHEMARRWSRMIRKLPGNDHEIVGDGQEMVRRW